jgi:hypothetical protein
MAVSGAFLTDPKARDIHGEPLRNYRPEANPYPCAVHRYIDGMRDGQPCKIHEERRCENATDVAKAEKDGFVKDWGKARKAAGL